LLANSGVDFNLEGPVTRGRVQPAIEWDLCDLWD
jgi:hypothetical protein